VLLPQSQLEASLLSILNDLCNSAQKRQEIASKAKSCSHLNATTEVAMFIEKAVKTKLTSKNSNHNNQRRGQ
jgi:UDP-N-acetylglucosamine:LPS N-acetylglucosamine transferase